MDNKAPILHIKRAGQIACFFLLYISAPSLAFDSVWKFDKKLQDAYQLILNLETEEAQRQLSNIETDPFHKIYVESFCETLDVLISEDAIKFQQIENNFKARFKFLNSQAESAQTLFLKAELNLQRGFNFLNLGEELNAVLAIRSAYSDIETCLKKYPSFIPAKKTSGVIQVMIGAVPDKYGWFLSLLGMEGSVSKGQQQLRELGSSSSSLNQEATILYYTIKGLINQQHEEASQGILQCLEEQPYNRLALFIGVNLLMKNSQSEQAFELISTLDEHNEGLPMYYIDYLRGEILLQKGEYDDAISAYKNFVKHYKSDNFKKDSYYKMALCKWLQFKPDEAQSYFDIARKTGKETAEPDRYATAQLKENSFPNPKLLKVRLSTDGGYYAQAQKTLATISRSDLTSEKDIAEYYYRKARLSHKLGDTETARLNYQKAIDRSSNNPWYFAPNSALQLGYLAQSNEEFDDAKQYFELALSYKKHEYKNSIDIKAKSALDQLAN